MWNPSALDHTYPHIEADTGRFKFNIRLGHRVNCSFKNDGKTEKQVIDRNNLLYKFCTQFWDHKKPNIESWLWIC